MTRKCMLEILGFIIKRDKEGVPATLEDIKNYWIKINESSWYGSHSNPLTEVLIDVSTLEGLDCIIKEEEERYYSTKFYPTDEGIITYERLRNNYKLPPYHELPSLDA